MSSNSGLWRHCRYTVTPTPLPNSIVVRNFTSIAYQNTATIDIAKTNTSQFEFVREFLGKMLEPQNMTTFTEEAKQRMFAHWVRNDVDTFQMLKRQFEKLVLSTEQARANMIPIAEKPIEVSPLDVDGLISKNVFGSALQKVLYNSTTYYLVIPEAAQMAIFHGWNERENVPKLFWPYVRDLGVPGYVLNDDRIILQLVPPKPPKSGRQKNGYDYAPKGK